MEFELKLNNMNLILSLSILSFVNSLFVWKYGSRAHIGAFLPLSILFIAVFPFFIYFIQESKFKSGLVEKIFRAKILLICIPLFIVIAAILFYLRYPQDLLRVDRYEMIKLFWDNTISNKCPYCPRAEGTNIPGPYPFYFFAAYPFYKINEIGFYSLSGLFLFLSTFLFGKYSAKSKNTVLMLVLISPAIWWELLCRSTIFLNSAMFIAGLMVLNHEFSSKWKRILVVGFIVGLIASTRSIIFVFLALSAIHYYRSRIFRRESVLIWTTALATFVITFIPILMQCKMDFLKYNPFTTQATLAPPFLFLIISLGSLFFILKEKSSLYSILGYVNFFLVTGYGIKVCLESGFSEAFFGSDMDISYFVFSFPFLLFSLLQKSKLSDEMKIVKKEKIRSLAISE
jgi:hypothetical protein